VKEPIPEQKNSKLPIFQVVLITLANLLAVGVGFVMTKRARTGVTANPSKYIPPKQVLEAIAGLEEKVIVNPDVAGAAVADSAAETGASVEGEVTPAAAEAAQPSADAATPSSGSDTEQVEAEGLADAVGALSDDVVNASEGAGEGESNGPAAATEEPKEG
jgi:ABC-type Na+ efflux pump permease subunit